MTSVDKNRHCPSNPVGAEGVAGAVGAAGAVDVAGEAPGLACGSFFYGRRIPEGAKSLKPDLV